MQSHLGGHTCSRISWAVLDGILPDQKLLPPSADLPKCYLLLSNSQTINCSDDIFILFYWFLETNSIHQPFSRFVLSEQFDL